MVASPATVVGRRYRTTTPTCVFLSVIHPGSSGFGWFYKYLVGSVQERDLTGGSPEEFTFYKYTNDASSDSALWAHDVNESVELLYRSWSAWRGYSTVTASKEVTETVETVNRNVYHRGMDGDGKATGDGSGVAWYEREAGLLTPIGTPGLDGAISGQAGKCLDIKGPSTVRGTLVHLYRCLDTWSQEWQWDPNTRQISTATAVVDAL